MSLSPTDAGPAGGDGAVRRSIHEHWILFLVEGVVLFILGVAALIVPAVAAIAATLFLGWMLLISGLIGLIMSFMARHGHGFGWALLSAFLGIAAGLVLLIWPIGGSISLTLVLIAFFATEGAVSVFYAISHRRGASGRWGWMLLSGIVDLILAAILLLGLPGTAFWALGLLVGINLMFGGAALIAMALAARGAAEALRTV